MTKNQKFKRGNLVEVLTGQRIWCSKNGVQDISPEDIGRKAIIEHSYAEKFGGEDINNYSIIWLDTGSSLAWRHADDMKLIDEGGEHLFEEAEKNKISKQNTNIDYIASNIDNLSSENILLLFDMIGHKTSFYKNGEFYTLYAEWEQLYPVFVHIKNAKTLKKAKLAFTKIGLEKYNVEKVYNEFHKIK